MYGKSKSNQDTQHMLMHKLKMCGLLFLNPVVRVLHCSVEPFVECIDDPPNSPELDIADYIHM